MQDNQNNNQYPNLNIQPQVAENSVQEKDGVEKIAQLVWYVVGLINVVLAIRIFFLLFNAQSGGFTGFLYNVTAPFVMPFTGIFPAPGVGTTYFDTAALVAIIIYSLVAWGVVTLIRIISNNQKVV
ncbi:MAG: YggT family protein [bacterium]